MSKIKFANKELEEQVAINQTTILSDDDVKQENLSVAVSIRLNAALLDKIKLVAQKNHTKYQTLVKEVLEHRFGEGSDPLFEDRFDDISHKLQAIHEKIAKSS